MALPTRIVIPATAKKGQAIEVKTIVQHPMETGYRRDHRGEVIPRDIIKRVVVTYAGHEVFTVDATQVPSLVRPVGYEPPPAQWREAGDDHRVRVEETA